MEAPTSVEVHTSMCVIVCADTSQKVFHGECFSHRESTNTPLSFT